MPTPNTDFEFPRGDTCMLTLTVTRKDANGVAQPVDLRLTNTEVRFTAKRKHADAYSAAPIKKTAGVAGGPGGITVPASAPGNVANIKIETADTSGFTKHERLIYDVEVKEPDGTRTTTHDGTLFVTLDVSNG